MMKTEGTKKVTIKIVEQENSNLKTPRKSLKIIQQAATDKENLVGRPRLDKDSKLALEHGKVELKRKRRLVHKAVQTVKITEEDLTGDEPSEDYWRLLAEQRGNALNDSFQEIERLKDSVSALQEENKICKEMLDESKCLVEVLQEMLSESGGSAELEEDEDDQGSSN